jgi:Coenzyme PQQ synthesis protein D (PqqD)
MKGALASMEKTSRPAARHDSLVVRELPGELLVYDTETHEAHCLNETAASVWKRCDGRTSVADIAATLSATLGTEIDEDVVWLALEDLWKRNLLVGEPAPTDEAAMSRSQLIRRSGIAAAVAVPVVMSVVAPTAAHAASCIPSGQPCSPGQLCCPNTQCPGSGICP